MRQRRELVSRFCRRRLQHDQSFGKLSEFSAIGPPDIIHKVRLSASESWMARDVRAVG